MEGIRWKYQILVYIFVGFSNGQIFHPLLVLHWMQMTWPREDRHPTFESGGPLHGSEGREGEQPESWDSCFSWPSKLSGIRIPRDGNWAFGVCLGPLGPGMLAKIAQAIKIPEWKYLQQPHIHIFHARAIKTSKLHQRCSSRPQESTAEWKREGYFQGEFSTNHYKHSFLLKTSSSSPSK